MTRIVLIHDHRHSELQQTEYASFQDAVDELRRRAAIPSTEPPNRAPCRSWRTCGRSYSLIEFEKTETPPWKSFRHAKVVEVSPAGVTWNPNYERDWAASRAEAAGDDDGTGHVPV